MFAKARPSLELLRATAVESKRKMKSSSQKVSQMGIATKIPVSHEQRSWAEQAPHLGQ
jgi:hypothetical protein